MSRLTWALAAAFVVHLVLLQVTVPVRDRAALSLRGSNHVMVRLTRLSEQPADTQANEPEPEPLPVVETEPQRSTVPEIQPELQREQVLTPLKRKTLVRDAGVGEQVAEISPISPDFAADTEQKDTPAPPAQTSAKSFPVENRSPDTGVVRQAEPVPSLNRPPVYPKLARKRGWEGTVLLEVDVNGDGTVASVEVRTSSSYTLLDREAVDAVRRWRFRPGTMGGRPMATKVIIPVHFMLQEN